MNIFYKNFNIELLTKISNFLVNLPSKSDQACVPKKQGQTVLHPSVPCHDDTGKIEVVYEGIE